MSFVVETDRSLIRAASRSRRYVLVRVTAPAAPPRDSRLQANIALVLDRSGSMDDERKFTLARTAVEQALRLLRPEDRFSLVVYDTEVDVLARSTRATPEATRRALHALESVGPRGGTDLGAGWLRGCEQVAEFLDGEAVSRCLLLTDGLANRGITDRGVLAVHAGELRLRGVATSTFGVGADFDERLLRDMAHEGGGNFYFIEGPSQIPEILTGELGEALEVTIRNAALELVLPNGVDAEPLSRFRHRRAHGDNELRIDLGDLVSEQEIAVVTKVTFPRGELGRSVGVRLTLTGDGALTPREEGDVSWTYASHLENDRQSRNRDVDREVATLYAAHARAEAAEANRAADLERARRILERTAERIESYAGDDAELQRLAKELRASVIDFGEAQLTGTALKAAFFASEMVAKSRMPMGSARRGGPKA
jgi:Ca-activated chloride channel family protein